VFYQHLEGFKVADQVRLSLAKLSAIGSSWRQEASSPPVVRMMRSWIVVIRGRYLHLEKLQMLMPPVLMKVLIRVQTRVAEGGSFLINMEACHDKYIVFFFQRMLSNKVDTTTQWKWSAKGWDERLLPWRKKLSLCFVDNCGDPVYHCMCSMQVVDITLMKHRLTSITSIWVVQQKHRRSKVCL
jgi:hypothetical protein